MTDSDSDSDNYESAEDSFEDSVEDESSKKQEESIKKEMEPILSRDDNFEISYKAGEKDGGNESLTYRKRPERVKRLSSKSPTRTTTLTKKTSADTVFKSDIISPDVFLQDITNSLSKNINKGLNTLQQKSSNVKDLILNSLPAGSVEKEKGFSYDEDITTSPVEDLQFKVSKSEGFITNTSLEIREAVLFKSEGNVDCEGEFKSQSYKKQSLIKNELGNDKINLKKEIHAENLIQCDKKIDKVIENEKFNLSSKSKAVSENFSCINKNCEENFEKVDSDKNNFKLISLDENLLENLNKNVSTEILKSSEKINNGNVEIENVDETTSDVNIKDLNENEKDGYLKNSKELNPSAVFNNVMEEENDVINSLSNLKTEKILESNLDVIVVPKTEANSECNFEELKTVLMCLVPDNENKEKNEELIEVKTLEASSSQTEANPTEVEGWDDFDFSDNDIDEQISPKREDDNKKPETAELKELKKSNNLGKKSNKNGKTENSGCSNKKEFVNFTLKETQITLPEKVKKNTEKPPKIKKQIKQNKSPNQENWEWDDWTDSSKKVQNKEEQKCEKIIADNFNMKESEKLEKGDSNDDFFDDSRWGGWENFGQKQEDKQSSWNLGSWGTNILSKATAVTQGISTVLEAGLGAPDPETFARMEKLEREKLCEQRENIAEELEEVKKKDSVTDSALFPVLGITNLVAGVTSKIVEHSKIQEIGSKVITGGLDTLETFGKKTMEVLQEGDPGLRSKRALFLGSNKPVLSQVLREAQEKADRELKKVEEKQLAKKCHFETLFDDFQGMVHLEALEMLSTQCELKLEQIKSSMNEEEKDDLDGILNEVEQLCSLEDITSSPPSMIDFKISINMAVESLKDEVSVRQIFEVYDNVETWLKTSSENMPSNVIHQKAVSTLAELTAATVHQFHKAGELLAVKECRKTVEEIDALSKMTTLVCSEIQKLSEKFLALAQKDGKTDLVEKIKTIMDNSRSYIKQAFNLLIPIIQIGAAI